MACGTTSARKVGKLPMSGDDKARVVRTKITPGALYGVEATPANRSVLGGYRAALVTASCSAATAICPRC